MKYNTYIKVGSPDKFILSFQVSSDDSLTKHNIYHYGLIKSVLDDDIRSDLLETIKTKLYSTLVPNSNITSKEYETIVHDTIMSESSKILAEYF